MKRLLRISLNVLTVLSLVLCVATFVLWMRSYWVADVIWLSSRNYGHLLDLRGGFVAVVRYDWFNPVTGQYGVSSALPDLLIPFALLAPAFGFLPALRLLAPLVRRRGRAGPVGLCPTCNYDLRATPDRCPECGTTAPKATR